MSFPKIWIKCKYNHVVNESFNFINPKQGINGYL